MKALKYTIISILGLVAILFVCWNLAPGWLTSELSKMMGVEVTIGSIDLGFTSVTAENVRISNPKGYKFRDALRIKSLKADGSVFSFLHENIVIDSVEGNDIYLDVEFDRKGRPEGNWSIIMGNLERSLANDEHKKSDKNVLIKLIVLKNITVDLVYKRENEVRRLRPIKQIVLRNIDSSKGIPTAQLTNIIMKQMLKEVFSIHNLANMLQNLLNPAQGNGINPLQGLFSTEVDFDAETTQEAT